MAAVVKLLYNYHDAVVVGEQGADDAVRIHSYRIILSDYLLILRNIVWLCRR